MFPDIPVKKKTPNEKAETEQWLAIRKEAGLKIDPETAEVDWGYQQTLDPYDVARSPGSDIWVHFTDLPDAVGERIWARLR